MFKRIRSSVSSHLLTGLAALVLAFSPMACSWNVKSNIKKNYVLKKQVISKNKYIEGNVAYADIPGYDYKFAVKLEDGWNENEESKRLAYRRAFTKLFYMNWGFRIVLHPYDLGKIDDKKDKVIWPEELDASVKDKHGVLLSYPSHELDDYFRKMEKK
tara:strand:+ start:2183 stop:2656 length:474 start_codon:yes stop_codon:yes gene_type:complete